MGIIWAWDFFFLFIGPEMQQSERNEEAAAALEYERLRSEGMSLIEIGQQRARDSLKVDSNEDVGGGNYEGKPASARDIEDGNDEEKVATAQHVEG